MFEGIQLMEKGHEKKSLYSEYKEELAEITNNLPLKEAMQSERKGSRKLRDHIVFLKMALLESLSYFTIILSLITFTALTPQAIKNINGFFTYMGIPYQLPVDFSTIAVVIIIAFIFIFGIITYLYFGFARRSYEVIALYNPINILLYEKLKNIEEKLEEKKS
jgi:CBS domain containing-hemolysin-like protein